MLTSFRTIKEGASCVYEINKSRFIATSARVTTEEEFHSFLAAMKKRYSDATHNCSAAVCDRLGNLMRFSDDGEPQGTAGMPILEVIRGKKLVETAVVVTRYFGGIKLGAGGLVRAYTKAAADVLDISGISVSTMASFLDVSVDYGTVKRLENALEKASYSVLANKTFASDVTFSLIVPEEREQELSALLIDTSFGTAKIKTVKKEFYPFSK